MSVSIERPKAVQRRVGISRTRMYALIAQGKFPKRVILGPKSVGFMSDEIDQWIEDRRREREIECRAKRYDAARANTSAAMQQVRKKAKKRLTLNKSADTA